MVSAVRIDDEVAAQAKQDVVGEQSLLIDVERRYPDKTGAGPQIASFMVLVVRVGLYVIVVYDKGREGGRTSSGTVFDTAREMLRRLTSSPSPPR